MMRFTCLAALLLMIAAPAMAQRTSPEAEADRPQPPAPARAPETERGEVAQSAVGQAGQRQTREDIAKDARPMARIDSRIQNRVHSRIRNRIDRYYDPQANAASPFEVAGEQARTAGRPRR